MNTVPVCSSLASIDLVETHAAQLEAAFAVGDLYGCIVARKRLAGSLVSLAEELVEARHRAPVDSLLDDVAASQRRAHAALAACTHNDRVAIPTPA